MPRYKGAARLEETSARRIASDLLDCLNRLCQTEDALNQINAGLNKDECSHMLTDRVPLESYSDTSWLQPLNLVLEGIPGLFLSPIHEALLLEYMHRCSQEEAELSSQARLKSLYLESGTQPNIELARENYWQTHQLAQSTGLLQPQLSPVPQLTHLLELLCQSKTLHLNLAPLVGLAASAVSPSIINEFKTVLTGMLPKMTKLTLLNLSSNSKSALPQLENSHLELIGKHCPNLDLLDVSYNRSINGEGLKHLVPNSSDPINHPGCVKLSRLFIFDTCIFEKDVAKCVASLPCLVYLGYKETGKVVKTLFKNANQCQLQLTHLDNRGSKNRRLVVTSLRCKKPVIEAISNLCPSVKNLKLRVTDDDVKCLACLEAVESVELMFHVGSISSPGVGTQYYLAARGPQLTTLALICNNMTLLILTAIAENCPNLTQLWFRSNHFLPGTQIETLPIERNYLTKLTHLYLRIGVNELYIVHNLPQDIIPFLVQNAPLKELILAIRSNVIKDSFIIDLIRGHRLSELEKVFLVVPGVNSLPGILNLTEQTVDYLINNCPNIKKIGNLLSWKLDSVFKEELMTSVTDMNWDLEIVDKKMTMR